jgi:hypothetical protein
MTDIVEKAKVVAVSNGLKLHVRRMTAPLVARGSEARPSRMGSARTV